MTDYALEPMPTRPKGRPAKWMFRLRGRQKRGAGMQFEEDFFALPRRVVTTFTHLEQSPDYVRRLGHSVDDFAYGADKSDPLWRKRLPYFTAASEHVAAVDVKKAAMRDDAIYRLMVNPFDGGRVMCRRFVRAYMARVERTVGARLLWVAAVHHKGIGERTDNRHAHIIIRSRTFGDEVIMFTRQFSYYGFRQIAAELVAELLGVMTDDEKRRADEMSIAMAAERERAEMRRKGVPEWAIEHMNLLQSPPGQ